MPNVTTDSKATPGRWRVLLQHGPTYLGAVGALFLAVLFLVNGYHSIRLMIAWYSPLPLRDYWDMVEDLPALFALHLQPLWRQHNEHRIVFPELIYLLDFVRLHGRQVLPLIVSALCYLGIWGVLIWSIYSQRAIQSPLREIAIFFSGSLMVWQGSAQLIAMPFQLQFTLLQFAVAIAFAFLAKLDETRKNIHVAGLIAAGVVATYSSGQGILVWPILITAAILLKVAYRQLAAITICGAAASGGYFIGYHSLGSLQVLSLLQHPAYLVGFVASYLSMPFGYLYTYSFGVKVGLFSLVVFGGCLAVAIKKHLWSTRLGLQVFGGYLFTLSSVLLTAAGRMDLNDPTFIAARAPRYVTVPLATWGALIAGAIWLLPRTRLRFATLPAALLSAWLAFLGCQKARAFWENASDDFANLQISSLMLRNNIEDQSWLLTIFPSVEFVKKCLPVLREGRLSVYARAPDKWLRRPLETLHPVQQPAPGQVTRIYPVEGGLQLYGWSDSDALKDEHAVLFVDQSGRVAGFGNQPRAGFPRSFGTWDTPRILAFIGFVHLDPSIQSLTLYVWSRPGKTLHPLGKPIAIPNFTPAASTGTPLPGITWKMDPVFTLNGLVVSAENGPPPPGPIYGSSTRNNSGPQTGELRTSAFAAPPGHCLVVPVLHDISAYGQSVEIVDSNTNQVIAAAPMLDGHSVWERWRVSIPPAVTTLFVRAKDSGDADRQWVAVATPDACP